MANLRISYSQDADEGVAAGTLGSETVVTSSTSAMSGAWPTGSRIAILFSDTDHWVTTGGAPTANGTNGFFLPANQPRPVRTFLADGQVMKFAAITA